MGLGNVITGGFSSTSLNFDSAFGFVDWRGGSLWAILSHISGKDISKFSEKAAEAEVLFPAGSRLQVVMCTPSTFSYHQQQQINSAISNLQRQGKRLDVICMREASAVSEAIV